MSSSEQYGRPYRYRQSFSLSRIVGDPFALSTISISIVGWIIAFAGSIAVDVDGKFPTLTWWGLVFQFFLNAGVIYIVATSSIQAYRLALVSLLGVATIYTTNSTNNFVWNGTPSSGAVAAGHILLSIINIIWTFYFGTTDDERIHAFIDSFSINGGYDNGAYGGNSMRRSNPFMARNNQEMDMYRNSNNNRMSRFGGTGTNRSDTQSQHPQMFTSAQLGGFENSSEQKDEISGLPTADSRNSSYHNTQSMQSATDALTVPTEYNYRAKAIYSYRASEEDANEISFEKGEILEVSDISGRWWQARRANGEVGICPSNYVQLEQGPE
jgi:SHO1 osmosensor